jgi:hypothetical protein
VVPVEKGKKKKLTTLRSEQRVSAHAEQRVDPRSRDCLLLAQQRVQLVQQPLQMVRTDVATQVALLVQTNEEEICENQDDNRVVNTVEQQEFVQYSTN